MRFVMINLLLVCLLLLGIGYLAFGDAEVIPNSEPAAHSHILHHIMDGMLWTESPDAFRKPLRTDMMFARFELQRVAKPYSANNRSPKNTRNSFFTLLESKIQQTC